MSLERKFFKIANVFMMIVASLALLSAIGGAIYGLMLQSSHVNSTITQPTANYSALKADKTNQKARKQARAEAATAAPGKPATPEFGAKAEEEEAIPPDAREVLNRIESSIDKFALKTGQPRVQDKLRSNIYHAAKEFERFVPISKTLAALETEAKALETDADSIAQLQKTDEEYIEWPEFLSFFFNAYKKNINSQLQAIEQAKAEAEIRKAKSVVVFMWAGGSFGSFIFTTIILLLFSIDKNIYTIRLDTCKNSHAEGAEA
ncbi:hypothetical protein FVW20_17965 [Desulfovibrio oxamicus]|uniref:Chemotaxis methyl-accepting receptor HlyB-like 4HB MCP domain-containing protein n=1 Tax=Nitratidesulfovibrio oxamicus TaxID=32016 RepID=A0ABS0J9L3_9BACT|nr:hypothetical protein [Nitratidesulfovibrio oxamicus]MBG3878832.1 hypothetical protein [Nitratidesulfovibrio oxamicus]